MRKVTWKVEIPLRETNVFMIDRKVYRLPVCVGEAA